MMQNDQIKQMTERFLSWELPENFNPDDGISFDPIANKGTAYERRRQPTGTNLFDYAQAEAMVRYVVEGLERTSSTKEGPSEGWCITMARLEGDAEISAGAIDHPLRCPPLGAPTTDSTDLETRLRELLAKATPGDWAVEEPMDHELAIVEEGKETYEWRFIAGCPWPGDRGDIPRKQVEANAAVIVALKNAAPAILDTLASYRAEITQLRDKLARARDGQSWKVVSEDTSWIDGRDVILLAHDMEIQGRYCPGEWSHRIDGDEWEGAVWSCFDDAVQFEIEEISNDLTLWGHGPVTHWRELSPRPAQLMKGQDDD